MKINFSGIKMIVKITTILTALIFTASCSYKDSNTNHHLEGIWVLNYKPGNYTYDTIAITDSFDGPVDETVIYTIKTDSGLADHTYQNNKFTGIEMNLTREIYDFDFISHNSGNLYIYFHDLKKKITGEDGIYGNQYQFTIINSDHQISIKNKDGADTINFKFSDSILVLETDTLKRYTLGH